MKVFIGFLRILGLVVLTLCLILCALCVRARLRSADRYHSTDPFLDAVAAGQKELLEDFLDKGENPNKHASYGYTPLTVAGWTDQAEIAAMLIRNGADVTVADEDVG